MRKDITITIDSHSRRIEYCVMEGFRFDPDTYFKFEGGNWVGRFPNFPIGNDLDLDVLIIAVGNPNSNSTMSVKIDQHTSPGYSLKAPFNRNGYGQFNEQIPVR